MQNGHTNVQIFSVAFQFKNIATHRGIPDSCCSGVTFVCYMRTSITLTLLTKLSIIRVGVCCLIVSRHTGHLTWSFRHCAMQYLQKVWLQDRVVADMNNSVHIGHSRPVSELSPLWTCTCILFIKSVVTEEDSFWSPIFTSYYTE